MVVLGDPLPAGRAREALATFGRRGGARRELRPPFEPIDRLPFLAGDFLDEPPGIVHMATQRGCPFPCTYCAARMYNELYGGTVEYGRRRSHQAVASECSGGVLCPAERGAAGLRDFSRRYLYDPA